MNDPVPHAWIIDLDPAIVKIAINDANSESHRLISITGSKSIICAVTPIFNIPGACQPSLFIDCHGRTQLFCEPNSLAVLTPSSPFLFWLISATLLFFLLRPLSCSFSPLLSSPLDSLLSLFVTLFLLLVSNTSMPNMQSIETNIKLQIKSKNHIPDSTTHRHALEHPDR